jgi:hypothetical protein
VSKTKRPPAAPVPQPDEAAPRPPRPLLVFARYRHTRHSLAAWHAETSAGHHGRRFERIGLGSWHYASDLQVVEHEGNDRAAVELIEGAK